MLVLRNIAAVSCSLLVAVSLCGVAFGSRLVIIPMAFVAIAAVVAASWFVTGKETPKFERIMLGCPNVLALIGTIALLLFVETSAIRVLLILLVSLLQAAYLTHLFFFLHVPTRYVPQTLETVAAFLQLLTIFSLATAAFGFSLMTEIPFAALVILFTLVAGAVLFQALWVAKIAVPRARTLAILGALMLAQLMITLVVLPTSLYVNGALVTLAAYAMHFLFRVAPNDPHFFKTARRVTLLASSLFLMLLVTAPWR